MKTLFKACYKDLWHGIFYFIFDTGLSCLYHIAILLTSYHHNFKTFDLLLEIFKNHGTLKDVLFLHSKIIHEHFNASISQLPVSSRNESAKIISCLRNRMTKVNNKIDTTLLSNNETHDSMWTVMVELKELKDQLNHHHFLLLSSTHRKRTIALFPLPNTVLRLVVHRLSIF